ncbi:hypothetical protein FR742_22965 [Nonomuraea sp. C10]|nr:hypothetical protein FR742_22965 [Nonomuraea sp. C10]
MGAVGIVTRPRFRDAGGPAHDGGHAVRGRLGRALPRTGRAVQRGGAAQAERRGEQGRPPAPASVRGTGLVRVRGRAGGGRGGPADRRRPPRPALPRPRAGRGVAVTGPARPRSGPFWGRERRVTHAKQSRHHAETAAPYLHG